MIIRKLKDMIKSLSGKDSVENVKNDIDEIETINIELEHTVAKLLLKNENLRKEREHLKSIYKDQFDSIRKTRVQSKEHCDSLIAQTNAKKLKKKNVVNIAVSKPNATVAPGMFKLDIEPISLRLKNNRDAHEVYIGKTIEYTDTLRGIKCSTGASRSNPSGNTKNNRNLALIRSKVFIEIGYSWKPIGRIFTIVGNRSPLTRITSTKVVPLKETTITPVITPSLELKVYSRKPKATRSVGSSSKSKIVESKTSNTKEPKQSWGSTISNVPSSFLI
ncbi:hypothetical protein Tco_0072277 [Tanacetum coccineum]